MNGLTPDQLRALDQPSRQMLRFHDISRWMDLAAQLILDHSFQQGRPFAHVTRQQFAAAGFDPRDLLRRKSTRHSLGILLRLAEARMIVIHAEADTYSFLPDASQWQASRLPVAVSAYQDVLRAILQPDSGSLDTALAAVSQQKAVDNIHREVRGLSTGGVGSIHRGCRVYPPEPPRAYTARTHAPDRLPEETTKPVTGYRGNGAGGGRGGEEDRYGWEFSFGTDQNLDYLHRLLEKAGTDGDAEFRQWGRRWRKWAQHHPGTMRKKLEQLADIVDAVKAGRERWRVGGPGACFNGLMRNALEKQRAAAACAKLAETP